MDFNLLFLVILILSLQPIYSIENFKDDFKSFVQYHELNKKFFSFDTIPSQYITRNTDLKNSHGPIYTIQVHFVDSLNSVKETEASSIITRSMLLGLYTSQNLYLNKRDVKSLSDQPKLRLYSQQGMIFNSPYKEINGIRMETALLVERKSFYNNEMSFIYYDNDNDLFANNSQVYGMIGMGISNSAKQNFHRGLPEFSVYLAPSGASGEVIFGVNQNLIDMDFHPLVYPASKDWEVSLEKSLVYFSNMTYALHGKMILDINIDGIGLPYEIYKSILGTLIENNIIECWKSQGFCTSKNKSLPDIILKNQYGNLTIPSELYVQGVPSSSGKMIYSLKLIGLLTDDVDTNIAQGKLIKIRKGYEEYIILGSPFLSYYYVSFRQHSNGPAIHIYKSKTDSGFFVVLMVSSFAICALAILGVLFYFIIWKKRQQSSQSQDQYYDISQASM